MFIAAGRRRLWPATQARARRIYRPCDPLSPSRGTRARAVVAGARTTPAVVALASNGEWIVGEAARAQAAKNRSGTVTRLLSLVGELFSTARALREHRGHTVGAPRATHRWDKASRIPRYGKSSTLHPSKRAMTNKLGSCS